MAAGTLNEGVVRPEIRDSWIRSYEAGVNSRDCYNQSILNHSKMNALLDARRDFVNIAKHFMAKLYEFVKGSGFMVVLSDERGYILETMGDNDILKVAANVNIVKGSRWTEDKNGTCGIGTAIVLKKAIQVSGEEHYCRNLKTWTCSAVPIFDNDKLIGTLQMSGPSHAAHLHTLGMVVAGAEAIQEQAKAEKSNRQLSVLNDSLSNIFNTMSDGAIIVNKDGLIHQINPVAKQMLGNKVIGISIEDILGENSTINRVLVNRNEYIDKEIMMDTVIGRLDAMVTAKPIKNEKGQVTGGVIFFNPLQKVKKLINRFGGARATFKFKDIIGFHESMRSAIRTAYKAAASVSNVLIYGESGTGKELFAQAIHNQSPRHKGPFLALNCAALPRDLIASELFGYTRGAFTGASPHGRPGKFEMASDGTLFLDEIGDMPLDQQTSLLRVIQEKKITRLGDDKMISVDCRIICATHKNLQQEVVAGNFRQDLYYRLNVVTVSVPPLRARGNDVLILFDHLLKKIGKKLGVTIKSVQPGVREYFARYNWPGNVRELENIIEKIINVADDGKIYISHLPAELCSEHSNTHFLSDAFSASNEGKMKDLLAEKERQIILDLLLKYNGNISQIAKGMSVSRNTLYRKMRLYNINKGYNFN